MSKRGIERDSEWLCAELAALGCAFHWEADNRGGRNSRYIFIRGPVAVKIRVGDHKSDRVEREQKNSRTLVLDVGPHGISIQAAIEAVSAAIRTPEEEK